MKLFIVSLMAVGLLTGCGSSKATATETVVEATAAIPAEDFDTNTGETTKEVTIKVESNGNEVAEVDIPAGTSFTDEDGNLVKEVPSVKAKETTTATEVTTEISFFADGKKVIPSEPVTAKVAAPAGSKPGDKVTIDVPDGVSAAKTGAVAEKLIVVVVGADGFVHVSIIPQLFKNYTVVVIIVRKVEASTN